MNRTVRWIGMGVVFVLCWGVAGARAQQRPVAAEPQAPSRTAQAPSEVVPTLAVPRLIKFAGTFKDAQGKPLSNTVGVTFAIYKEPEGGAALWLETQNVELDEQGHYTALLGATKSEGLPLELFSSGEPRWLGVQVNLPKELEQARVLLVSVPYALKAADAETLGGKPLSSFVLVQEAGEPGASGTAASGRGKAQASTAPGITAVGPIVGLGTVNQVAKFTPDGLTIGDAAITEVGGKVGIGTLSPQASLDVQLTTGSASNAINSTITLNNSAPILGSVLSAFKMTLVDASKAANLSKQPARFVYLRDAAATGGVTAFDAVMTATSFLSADAPYQLRGVNIEGPTITAGKTLGNFTGLYIGSPGGGGTVTAANALVTEPNAGNVGIGTTAPTAPLEVAGNVKLSGVGNAIIFPDNTVMSTATPGVGGGTITGVTPGTGLTGGGTVGGVSLGIANGGIVNSMLAANSVSNANIADGSLSPGKITGTAATLGGNTFTGTQTINGNVGIGTTSPVSRMHIVTNPGVFPPRLQSSGFGSFGAGWDFYHGVTGKGYVGVPDADASLAPGEMLVLGGLNTRTTIWAGGQRGMTVATDGKVDIGGEVTIANVLRLNNLGCAAGIGVVTPLSCSNYMLTGQTNGGTFINSSGTGEIHFRHNNVEADQMTIRTTGDVGIGTGSPAAKLDVAGNLRVGTGIVNNGGGFKHLRAGPFILAAGVVAAAFEVNWPTPFADANYTVTATIQDPRFFDPPTFVPLGTQISSIFNVTPFGFKAVVERRFGVAAVTFFINVIAIHD